MRVATRPGVRGPPTTSVRRQRVGSPPGRSRRRQWPATFLPQSLPRPAGRTHQVGHDPVDRERLGSSALWRVAAQGGQRSRRRGGSRTSCSRGECCSTWRPREARDAKLWITRECVRALHEQFHWVTKQVCRFSRRVAAVTPSNCSSQRELSTAQDVESPGGRGPAGGFRVAVRIRPRWRRAAWRRPRRRRQRRHR